MKQNHQVMNLALKLEAQLQGFFYRLLLLSAAEIEKVIHQQDLSTLPPNLTLEIPSESHWNTVPIASSGQYLAESIQTESTYDTELMPWDLAFRISQELMGLLDNPQHCCTNNWLDSPYAGDAVEFFPISSVDESLLMVALWGEERGFLLLYSFDDEQFTPSKFSVEDYGFQIAAPKEVENEIDRYFASQHNPVALVDLVIWINDSFKLKRTGRRTDISLTENIIAVDRLKNNKYDQYEENRVRMVRLLPEKEGF